MSPRSQEFMDQARDRLELARVAFASGHQHLHAFAQRAQKTREQGDYEAITPAPDEAKTIVEGAGDFIAAVEQMLAAS